MKEINKVIMDAALATAKANKNNEVDCIDGKDGKPIFCYRYDGITLFVPLDRYLEAEAEYNKEGYEKYLASLSPEELEKHKKFKKLIGE